MPNRLRTRSHSPARRGRHLAWTIALVGVGAGLAPCVPARADDSLESINSAMLRVPESRRSDVILLPVLAGIEAPPASVAQPSPEWIARPAERAALLGAGGPGWAEWEAWCEGAPQKAVLETLPRITEERDYRRAFAFAQPYGVEGVSVELITSEMYTDLGDPPLLARANHLYLPRLEHMETLVHVEASRLLRAGEANSALELLTRWALFTRQFADRPMLKEKLWAMQALELALVRLRDVAYTDFRSEPRKMTVQEIVETVDILRQAGGYMDLDRITLPEGEFAAKLQLIGRVMDPRGEANAREFSKELARITTTDRPLRRFAAAAHWEQVRAGHAGDLDTRAELNRLRNDWTTRWRLSHFDPILHNITEYRKNVRGRAKFALLDAGIAPVEDLFDLRQRLRAEAAGTRMGLAAYAFVLQNNHMPPSLSAVRPAFTKGARVDKDPYSSPRHNLDLDYFVPGRDTPKNVHGEEQIYHMQLFPPKPHPEFDVPLRSDQFVIYSVGPDDRRQLCQTVTQDRRGVPGDYLLWPPMLSLERQYLKDQRQLR